MTTSWLDVFYMPFMQRALIVGGIVGFLGGYYGVFIVQRKMSFLGSGLAHSAFGGVALGLLLGIEPLYVAVPFTLLVALGIVFLKEKTSLGHDTAIGILFAVSMALGIVFLSLKASYTVDAFSYLFGSILTAQTGDIIFGLIVTGATILTFFGLWQRWAYATFDSELAGSDKQPVVRDDYLLSIMIALTVAVSIKIAGMVLIAAFIVIPAAAARMIAGSFFKMTVISVIIGIVSSLSGLIFSYILDLPSGAVIILLQAVIFAAAAIFSRGIKR